jgi:hypothetical protein
MGALGKAVCMGNDCTAPPPASYGRYPVVPPPTSLASLMTAILRAFELLWLPMTIVLAWVRPRHDLVLENLPLRHQLAILTRPTRTRPRVRLCTWDKLV